MPIHRGPRLNDLISRLSYRAMPIVANAYQTWPNLATGLNVNDYSPVGAWVEFISAVNAPTVPFTIMICDFDDTFYPRRWEVGMGSAGSEVSVASAYGFGDSYLLPQPIPIIPGGTRVALRALSEGSIVTLGNIKIISIKLPTRLDPYSTLLLSGRVSPWTPPYSTLSTATGGSSGSQVATGVASWTYGAYTELHAATAETANVILTAFSCNLRFADYAQVALATGASGSEVDFLTIPTTSSALNQFHIELPIPLILPGSTRVAMRLATQVGNSGSGFWSNFTCVKSVAMP